MPNEVQLVNTVFFDLHKINLICQPINLRPQNGNDCNLIKVTGTHTFHLAEEASGVRVPNQSLNKYELWRQPT